MQAIARMRAVVLDCPDPRALAEFYRALMGGEITYADDDWVNLRDGGNVLLSFQRAPDYKAPDCPNAEHGQQFHIDATVGDALRVIIHMHRWRRSARNTGSGMELGSVEVRGRGGNRTRG